MAFNINAQVILSGPKNIKAVTNTIKQQLGNINVNVGVNVPKNASQQVKGLQTQMNALNTTTKRLNAQSATTGKQMKNVAQNTKQAANAMQVLGKETALTFKRFAAAGIVTATFFRLTNAISEAVPKALEFERELVKIQQTTGGTINQLNGLRKTADELAKSLGLDANEIISVGRVFAQTGQTLDQVESSLRAVARASLAPSFGEMENTAEGLIAALAQFNIQASQSEAVLASINAVSKQFAVESQDIIGAIRRTGGVFAIAATDAEKPVDALNQLIAIFTSVRSTTRESAETIATGLRTIFSRIQRPQTIEFLKSLNINLTDAEGNFVGLFSAFRILSTELDGIIARGDTLALSKVVEELGGIRQVGKLIPAIREFRKAEAAFNVAAEGATAGLGQDVQTGLTPLIKTFEQVQARFESLIRTISESATFQILAKTVAGIANAFLSLSETLTPLLPSLTAFAALKIAGGVSDFAKGFLGSGRAGGGIAGAGAALGGAVTGGAGAAQAAASNAVATATAANTQALTANTTAITSINTAIGNINTTAVSLNQTATNLNASILRLIPVIQAASARSALGGGLGGRRGGARPPRGFNRGGFVPGTGNSDTVPAMLTPGEFVIKKSAVQAFGAGNLNKINKYQRGTKGRGVPEGTQVATITMSGSLGTIFANPSEKIISYDKDNLSTKSVARRNAIENIQGLSAFGPEDIIETKFDESKRISSHFLNQLPERSFSDLVTDRVSGVVESIAEELVQRFDVPQLFDANIDETVNNALKDVDFKSLSGHIFEGVTASATGAKLTETGASFDFVGLDDSIRERINKLFTPDVGDAISILEAKNRATSDATNKISDAGSVINKILRSAGEGNPLDVKASIKKFASGGMASGTDTVPALLTPGEFVVNKSSAQAFGYGNLNKINKYADGGIVSPVQMFQNGSTGRGVAPSGTAISTKQLNKSLKTTSKTLDATSKGAAGAAGGLFATADGAGKAAQALFLLPSIIDTISQVLFGSQDAGSAFFELIKSVVLFNLASKALDPKTFLSATKGLKTFVGNLKSGAVLQRKINESIVGGRGVRIPGERGFTSRTAVGQRISSGGVGSRVGASFETGGIRGAGKQIGREVSKSFIAESRSIGRTIGTAFGENAAKAGTKFGGNAAKFIVRSAGGFATLAASLLVEPIGNSIADAILGASEEISPGITGRRGVSARQAGVAGGAIGAAEGALIGLALLPILGPFGVAIAAFSSAIDGFEKASLQQAQFLAFEGLQKQIDNTAKSFENLNKSASSQNIDEFVSNTRLLDQNIQEAFEARVATGADRSFGESVSRFRENLLPRLAAPPDRDELLRAIGIDPLDFIDNEARRGIAERGIGLEDVSLQEQAESFRRVLSEFNDEFLNSVRESSAKINQSILQRNAALDDGIGSVDRLATAGEVTDGLGNVTGDITEFVDALSSAGAATGQSAQLVDAYKSSVQAAAIQFINSGNASDEFTGVVQRLGKNLGTATTDDLNFALDDLGITNEVTRQRVIDKVKALRAEDQALIRAGASSESLAAKLNELREQLDALGAGLNKLNGISSGATARFDAFVTNFEAEFDRAFSSDATLTLPARFDPFANLDAATPLEIADGLERIRNAIGDVQGGQNQGVTAGFESILATSQELPFALKNSIEELRAQGQAEFATADQLIKALFDNLGDAAPTGQARRLIEQDIRARFTSRQQEGGGGLVALEQDLVQGAIDSINEGGEAVKQALSDLTQTLNEYQSAQLRAAQVTIEIANKRREFELKELDIRQRGRDFLGLDRNRDPRAVAEERLANRLTTIQTNVAGVTAGGIGLQAETGVEGLTANLKLLESEIGPLRAAVEAGTANPEEIKRLAALETALSETKQSLDTLADDTSRLSAIQDRLAQIESRKQSAQEQVLDFNRRRAEAVRSGNFEELARLNEEFRRPLDALRKIRAGEGLTDVEAADLEGGLGLLEGGGFIGPDEARKIRNALTDGIVRSDFFRNVFAGFTIDIPGRGDMGPMPVRDFVTSDASFGAGRNVGEETNEERLLRREGEELIDERVDAAQARFKAAQDQLVKARDGELSKIVQLEQETRKAEQAFLDAGGALGVLRGEAARLPAAVGQPPAARPAAGAGAAIGPQGGAPVADPNGGGLALIATTIPNNTAEMALLRTEIQLLKDQISQGLNVNLNGNQNINIANLATAGNEFQQITELTTARAFAEKTPELEQQFGQTMTSQLNTA